VAHATGIGFVDPPGLEMRNFKTDVSGCEIAYESLTDVSGREDVLSPLAADA
jgi:hypothetical protein